MAQLTVAPPPSPSSPATFPHTHAQQHTKHTCVKTKWIHEWDPTIRQLNSIENRCIRIVRFRSLCALQMFWHNVHVLLFRKHVIRARARARYSFWLLAVRSFCLSHCIRSNLTFKVFGYKKHFYSYYYHSNVTKHIIHIERSLHSINNPCAAAAAAVAAAPTTNQCAAMSIRQTNHPKIHSITTTPI